MKILVTYMSQTGNTRRVAEAIYGEIKGDCDIKEIKDVKSLDGYDISFVGFPIHAFGPAQEADQFLREHSAGKRIALFITHAASEGDVMLQEWLAKCREASEGADIIGMFDCQGELAQPIMDMLINSDDPMMRAFGEQGPLTKGQPDKIRLKKAQAFALEIIEGAKV